MKDNILLYRIRAKGDTDAFAELYDLYVTPIYRFVYLKVSHKQDAEDITSDVFLKTWRYLTDDPSKEIKSIRGLLYTIARNRIIDFYRERAKKNDQQIEFAADIADEHDLDEAISLGQDMAVVVTAVQQLKQEYQEIVLLKYIEEYSTAEIAAITGKSRTAVRVTIHRAVKKLKEILEAEETHV